ncbi:hypothetical protein LJC34_01560 [Oscillospiraceae bacterium OttesenSCG-928-G22]|nr:hypothetical protein [Oscillospiraceae bacterium OttesenSCG-928-G22]
MTIREVKETLNAEVFAGEVHLDREIRAACASDLMSDVLAFVKDQSLLLTGLLNLQTIRTADMMDIICIVFVRGKKPDATMIELANKRDIVLMTTGLRMYPASGKLYKNGLIGVD